eukprot:TRINITY_DN8255_c0_g1_i1.p1 TRINITY_DN8255_c0_g1~~TRINITY_DN8255_c0_g1_i1.p1  ORF type:complete len:103 (+),score=25.30 TRINITY_DN8255_c0_g1_i1:38-310(+)
MCIRDRLECALGYYPFLPQEKSSTREVTYWEMLDRITHTLNPKIEGDFSPKFKDFIAKCLDKNKETRINSKDLLDHPFLKGYEKINVTKI